MSDRLKALAEAGVSIWLDDLSRERIETGNLADLVKNSSVTGVTTNPTIFAAALKDGERYDEEVASLVADGASVEDVTFQLTTEDVRAACDILAEVSAATENVDGKVSIEVEPHLAFDTEATCASGKKLWQAVDRPNLLVKVPATSEGIPAITSLIGEGISVNVTLIFGLDRYEQVMEAYLSGLESAKQNGHDLRNIHSVASFFVSRVDSEVDSRLDAIGTPEATRLKGRAAIANARLAYERFHRVFTSDRWAELEEAGGRVQRPLWASTGVKNPAYSDVMYVTELVTRGTVNTMPEKTLQAFAEHGVVEGERVKSMYDDAHAVMAALGNVGIDYDDVIAALEQEGVDKFVASWDELVATVQGQMEAVAK